jgi:mRNA interferase MazF
VVLSSDTYNRSRIATVLAAVVSSNTDLAALPGNVFVPAAVSGLPRDSTINVTAIVTLDKSDVKQLAGHVPEAVLADVDSGLRMVMDL